MDRGVEDLRNKVKELLQDSNIVGFLGMRRSGLDAYPYLFTAEKLDELESLTIGEARYPLSKVLIKLAAAAPDGKLGIMVRGCDEKSLFELFKNNQLNPQNVVALGVACSDELAKGCLCPKPYPTSPIVGEVREIPYEREDIKRIQELSEKERFEHWMFQFGKCLRCYGCRNICPVCFCSVCTLEDQDLVKKGRIPPEVPSFHVARAFHMVGRCIDCGLCEEACPVDIPLRTLYRRVREIVNDLFGYLPGEDRETPPPIQILGDGSFGPR